MDPLAHTLFGATLSEAGLKKKTALAGATLIIGANLPDIDAVAMFVGSDYSLLVRRGWTHGVLALILWPFILTGLMLAAANWLPLIRSGNRDSEKKGDTVPLNVTWLFGLSVLAVWSHPFLDWLNTYGIRLLMPFSERWFYGDSLFIVDPWMWLLLGAGVVLGRSSTKWSAGAWILLGAAVSAIVTGAAVVPFEAKVLWWAGISLILLVRWSKPDRRSIEWITRYCLAAVLFYILAMYILSDLTVRKVESFFSAQGIEIVDVLASPLPARPFQKTGVAVSGTHYYLFEWNLLSTDQVRLRHDPLPVPESDPGPVLRAALETDTIAGLQNWIRYPYYEVEELAGGGWRVTVRDLRYVHPEQQEPAGIGMGVVLLDRNLKPVVTLRE